MGTIVCTSFDVSLAFAALIYKYEPDAIDFHSMDPSAGLQNATMVCKTIEQLGIKVLFTPSDLVFNTTINMVADQLVEYVFFVKHPV
jgi:hypothetical protein